jgi:hypothetical protein
MFHCSFNFFSHKCSLLATSQFWIDVNKKVDSEINFSQLENYFKVSNENNNTTLPTKAKPTAVRTKALSEYHISFKYIHRFYHVTDQLV